MTIASRTVRPGTTPLSVVTDAGESLTVPSGWALLPPGDAGLTRRVKAAGPAWTVQEKVGRRMFSRGVWAPAAHIETARGALATERADPAYAKKLGADRERREKKQVAYVEDFRGAVVDYLAFHPRHAEASGVIASAVTEHATPVGSGTVARTERIPLAERAESAVIAWMRHQTTSYDDMVIPRVKGERRRVRRMLAERSKTLLDGYRKGAPPAAGCPLQKFLEARARKASS